ncbi:hypothetical protein BX600DRAFT_440906 [Xylariales sp. PMI_506]|nr:hypothetical protein BX600DRAFT_440906 [Xylariales sp. PMI_506]
MKSACSFVYLGFCYLASHAAAETLIALGSLNPTDGLVAFHQEFFNGLFITSNDTLFEETYNTGYTSDVAANCNGVDYTFDTFKSFLEELRSAYTNRTIVSTDYVAVGDDLSGLTGAFGHHTMMSAEYDGSSVTLNLISNLYTVLGDGGVQVNNAERAIFALVS